MGVDYIEEQERKYQKTIDLKRADLAKPDILNQRPNECAPHYLAKSVPDKHCKIGQKVIVELHAGEYVACTGNDVLLKFVDLPKSVKQQIASSGCSCGGTIVSVNPVSGRIGVTLS